MIDRKLAILIIFLFSRLLPVDAADELPADSLQKTSQQVLKQLRDGDVESALQSLDSVADASLQIESASTFPLAQAGAALHQAIAKLSSDAQYDLLRKWSIKATNSPRIQHFVTLVPVDAPPMEFLRVLGDRPRPGGFPIASVGPTRGIFSTGWQLVTAARDCGKLSRLIAELTPLAEKKIPGSESLLLLARIADDRIEVGNSDRLLAERIERLATSVASNPQQPMTMNAADVVLAIAAVQHSKLFDRGEQFLAGLVTASGETPSPVVRSVLQTAHGMAVMLAEARSGNTPSKEFDAESALKPRFKHWIAISSRGTPEVNVRVGQSIWLTHDEHFFHLAGSGTDGLICRYPLSGEFQFQCDAQVGGSGKVESGLQMDGLRFHLNGPDFRVLDSGGKIVQSRPSPYTDPGEPAALTYNRLSITSTALNTRLEINRHPLFVVPRAQRASPWLGLSTRSDNRPLFRNLIWTGDPIIPRQVELLAAQAERSWNVRGSNRWQFREGTLERPAGTNDAGATREPSLLSYFRPLLDGESVTYEFFQDPDKYAVHPAFGRLAFLLRSDGVRVRWVTSNDDWTLLPPDNTVAEPINRRGPRSLPLKSGDWNQLVLSRIDQALSLKLNGELVYQRPIDWTDDQKFGLYCGEENTGSRVRNVTLTGNWPETLPKEIFDNPTALIDDGPRLVERRANDRLIRDEYLASNVHVIRKRALALPLEERFRYLSTWILPGPDHGFRMSGSFTQTYPAPSMQEPNVDFPERGGEIVSPVFDWLNAARELGRLEECLQRVRSSPRPQIESEYQERSRLALMLLLGLELGIGDTQTAEWDRFFALVTPIIPIGYAEQWPETILGAHASKRFPGNELVRSLIARLLELRANKWRPDHLELWDHHWTTFYRRILNWHEAEAARQQGAAAANKQLRGWLQADASRAATHGRGFPAEDWERRDNRISKGGVHDLDFLFFQLPLKGDFQFESEMSQSAESPQVMIGNYVGGVVWDLKNFLYGNLRSTWQRFPIDPPLFDTGKPSRFRGEVRDNTYTIFVNGRKVHEEILTAPRDPWVAIRIWGRVPNYAKNVTLSGNPTVLESVPLVGVDEEMSNWVNYHYDGSWRSMVPPSETESSDDPDKINQEKSDTRWIVGLPDAGLAGTFRETLLRYPRPLIEDGQIEYEFYYEPNQFEVHPALDRLALMIKPGGIQEHWITDGEFDRTALTPDNLTTVATNQRGPNVLPLKLKSWNHVVLTLKGDTASVELNDVLVYERKLESGNRRNFGFFRYLDATNAHIRHASMRGDWPKVMPSVAEQELADPQVVAIDAGISNLKAVFHHQFVDDLPKPANGATRRARVTIIPATPNAQPQPVALSDKFFQWPSPPQLGAPTPNGFQVQHRTVNTGVGSEICARFSLSGDFDVVASFKDWEASGKVHDSGCCLRVVLDEPGQNIYDLSRIISGGKHHYSHSARHLLQQGRVGHAWVAEPNTVETTSGRFRIARRGDQMHWLLAEGDSRTFHHFLSEKVSTGDVDNLDVRLHSFTNDGHVRHLWESVTLRAEKMSWWRLPDPSTKFIKVIDMDGKILVSIPTPEELRPYLMGSPEWSSDGKLICADVWRGSGANSRILVMNSDGTNVRDVAAGAMPSFSPDSKRIAFCRNGIMTMNVDGTDVQTVDAGGWGTQWSPDGKWIAYGRSGNVMIWDTQTKQSRPVMKGPSANKYSYILHNLSWSHDSKAVAFKAHRSTGNDIDFVVADIETGESHVLIENAGNVSEESTFSHDNQQVIVGYLAPETKVHQLYVVDRKAPGVPKLLPIQPEHHVCTSCTLSPDGKRMIVLCDELARPVEWTPELAAEHGAGLPLETR